MSSKIFCTPIECVKLRKDHTREELDWSEEIAAIYGCRPISKESADNLAVFIADVFHAGRISAIREERIRRHLRRSKR